MHVKESLKEKHDGEEEKTPGPRSQPFARPYVLHGGQAEGEGVRMRGLLWDGVRGCGRRDEACREGRRCSDRRRAPLTGKTRPLKIRRVLVKGKRLSLRSLSG